MANVLQWKIEKAGLELMQVMDKVGLVVGATGNQSIATAAQPYIDAYLHVVAGGKYDVVFGSLGADVPAFDTYYADFVAQAGNRSETLPIADTAEAVLDELADFLRKTPNGPPAELCRAIVSELSGGTVTLTQVAPGDPAQYASLSSALAQAFADTNALNIASGVVAFVA